MHRIISRILLALSYFLAVNITQAADSVPEWDFARAEFHERTTALADNCVPLNRRFDSVSENFPKESPLIALYDPSAAEKLAAARVNADDTIVITLQAGYLDKVPGWRGFLNVHGEVAIVARVFEFNQDEHELNFGAHSEEKGRVVYYTGDAKNRDRFNAAAIPAYGPITWHGNPLGVELYMVEINSSNDNLSQMLSTVAGMGRSAYAPASPILNILEKIGSSLLQNEKAKVFMRYHTVFWPGSGQRPELKTNTLEYGDYVFLGDHDKNSFINWGDFDFNRRNGMIYKKGSDCREPHKDSPYLTLQINSAASSTTLDTANSAYLKFGDLLKEINADSANLNAAWTKVGGDIQKLAAGKNRYTAARKLLDELVKPEVDIEHLATEMPEAATAFTGLLGDMQTSINCLDRPSDKSNCTVIPYSSKQIDTLLEKTRQLVARQDSAHQAFCTRALFSKEAIVKWLKLSTPSTTNSTTQGDQQ